jgi:cytoskeletal protein RodZ
MADILLANDSPAQAAAFSPANSERPDQTFMKVAHQGQLMLSIGALLTAEREKRGIPVERAAKETRMRPQRIRDMESDDLSHFTNPSYARMFLIAYAKYLGIPMQTIRDHLPDRGEPSSEGYNYIHAAAETLPSLRKNLTTQPLKKSSGLRLLLGVTAVVVLICAALIGTYLYINLGRLTAVVDKTPATKSPVLTNLQPGADKSSTLETQMQIAAPPAPSATPILAASASASATPAVDTSALTSSTSTPALANAPTAEAPAPSPAAAAPEASATPAAAAKPADSPSAADRAFLDGGQADQKPTATPQ